MAQPTMISEFRRHYKHPLKPRQLRHYPRLSQEEEQDLAGRKDVGDKRAFDRLFMCNVGLVFAVSETWATSQIEFDENVQEGYLGLHEAVKLYRKGHVSGAKFSTFAVWYIFQAVYKAKYKRRLVYLPDNVIRILNKVRKKTQLLQFELGRLPTTEEVAERVGLLPHKLRKYLLISLKEQLEKIGAITATTTSPYESMPEPFVTPEEGAATWEQEQEVRALLATLKPREEKVLRMRLGIGQKSEYTLEEIGAVFELTKENIRQIEAKALRKLRHPSRSKKLRSFVSG